MISGGLLLRQAAERPRLKQVYISRRDFSSSEAQDFMWRSPHINECGWFLILNKSGVFNNCHPISKTFMDLFRIVKKWPATLIYTC